MKKYEYKPENAMSYGEIGIEGTSYNLAFCETKRMLGDIRGQKFLDFGSGAGRSAKFLKNLGAEKVIGVDHNHTMITLAQADQRDGIEFHLITDRIPLADSSVDGALSFYAFPEIKTVDDMRKAMTEIARVVKNGGVFVLVTANPKAFGHDFKHMSRTGNLKNLKSGDITKCIIKGENPFVIEDIYWTKEDYCRALESSGFTVEEVSFPKAETKGDWIEEAEIAPEMVIKARKLKILQAFLTMV